MMRACEYGRDPKKLHRFTALNLTWLKLKNLTHLLLRNYKLASDLKHHLERYYSRWTSSHQKDFFVLKFLNAPPPPTPSVWCEKEEG